MRIIIVLLAGAALLPASALGQTCVSSQRTGISGDTLTLHGTDTGLGSLIAGAEDIWDDCGMSGIPTISQGTGGDLDYTVYIVDLSSGPACGVTDPNTREITIARRYTYNGRQYDCNLNTVLAHEIGHIFGLADSGCGGYLMSQVNLGQADTRSLQAGECTRANQNVTTTTEQEAIDREAIRCSTTEGGNGTGCGSPLILDMNHDGINTTPLEWPVIFDFEGDGRRVETSWTDPSTEEAFLALDLNGNGVVDSGRELFGNSTLLPSGEAARQGFEALAVYDDSRFGGDEDGRITPRDRIWPLLWLWTDRDHDGISDSGELRPLRSSRVHALHLGFLQTRVFDGNVNWHRFVSSYSTGCQPALASCTGEGLLVDVFFDLQE
jgi:hypothetical protein